jgi:TatD DNase family protein
MLIDTHCHIHDVDYPLNGDEVIARAHQAGVMKMICIGTDPDNSRRAIKFVSGRDGLFASAGIHPHYAKDGIGDLEQIIKSAGDKLVAIGEIGLDYHYNNSPREVQIELLNKQIELALKYNLPIIFHVRDAYDDFWSVLDNFKSAEPKIRGVLHCFTDTMENAEKGLARGLYFGINGISTFTKDDLQKAMFAALPLDRILLETDAPFLTPAPFRGKIKVNEPAFIKNIAEYNGAIRQTTFDEIANVTTVNASKLFSI